MQSWKNGYIEKEKRSDDRIAKIPCSRIKKRINNLEKAIKGREKMRDECFKNGPDPENPKIYNDHIDEIERKKLRFSTQKMQRNRIVLRGILWQRSR